ncbi:MAG: hydroxymethylglutaryl-CoA lyase [Burkholderiaceae bacterium]
MTSNTIPTRVTIREVGPRDGLQSIARVMPTAAKKRWIQDAYDAGLREIEVGSFVPPRLLPQMADSAEVVAFATTLAGLNVVALVPNLMGAQRALDAGAHQLVMPISASVAHSRANVRKVPEEMIDELGRITRERDVRGLDVIIEGAISTAFGCGIQGKVEHDDVLRLIGLALDAGADVISLADTVGYADPAAVRKLFTAARSVAGDRLYGGHFHDTRGLALANVVAAMDCGIAHFDSSLAGIGGCPFAPGASGNVATEDLVYMLESMGIATGIDLDRLFEVRRSVARDLEGEELHGAIFKAGLPKTMLPATAAEAMVHQ